MTTLHLGVLDVGYTADNGATTTGDVAGYLEDRFHVMRLFAEENAQFIGDQLAQALLGAIETAATTGKPVQSDLRSATSKIEARFRAALDAGELNQILPTKYQVSPETLMRSTRKKSQKLDVSRAAFVDTGLYQQSFRAWLTNN